MSCTGYHALNALQASLKDKKIPVCMQARYFPYFYKYVLTEAQYHYNAAFFNTLLKSVSNATVD